MTTLVLLAGVLVLLLVTACLDWFARHRECALPDTPRHSSTVRVSTHPQITLEQPSAESRAESHV
jgi:hypothetical protein